MAPGTVKTDQTGCFTILMAEDDPDDRFVMEEAFQQFGSCGDLRFVEDWEDMIPDFSLSTVAILS
jgi:hypothetical protein